MIALDFLRSIKWLPMSTERCERPSNSEIKRWLRKKAVIINNQRPLPEDTVNFPITELVFFPNGKRKCTMV